MLLYDHIFHREMCSMICQTGMPLTDWPRDVTSHHSCNILLEKIVKINFNNDLLLNEIELVHIFFASTNKCMSYYFISVRKLYEFYRERLFNSFTYIFCAKLQPNKYGTNTVQIRANLNV